jgi:predicted 2-oxoglutarate/Fe(II)-dependent dioxygenase YbiX
MIIQIDDALGKDACRNFAKIYDSHAHRATQRDVTGHPVVHWFHIQNDPNANDALRRLVLDCLRLIYGSFRLSASLYPETVILATMGPGGRHPWHADNCQQNGQGDWIPNHTPQRDVSAIYYLNDDFEGGEIVFAQWGLWIKPRRGLLVAFPSDRSHAHEVVPVRTGFRYTVPIWFTHQEAFALPGFALNRSTYSRD